MTNRYQRHTTTALPASHPYELRIDDGERIQRIPVFDLDLLKREYSLEFLRSPDVAVMDLRDKPKSILF